MDFENLNVGFGNHLLGIWLVRMEYWSVEGDDRTQGRNRLHNCLFSSSDCTKNLNSLDW